jgi:hypothetical protein
MILYLRIIVIKTRRWCKTKEEIAEEARIRKQTSRDKKRDKMGDEEFRKMRAKQAAEDRKKRAK